MNRNQCMSKYPRNIAICLVLGMSGCTSVSSTVLTREDSDSMSGNSNGHMTPFHANKPFKGIPVTVRVPTHVDIRIDETLYFQKESMNPIPLSSRHFTAHPEVVYSDKLISVDPKRPASGTLNYTLGFPNTETEYYDRQHFNKVTYGVDDNTIKTITGILNTVVPSLPKPKGLFNESLPRDTSNSLSTLTRTVAWKRFDISSPDFERSIADFVSLHLNSCHGCGENACITNASEGATMAAPIETYPVDVLRVTDLR